MRQVVRCDRALIWTTLLLVLVGLVTVYTASADIAARQFGGSQVLLKRTAWRATLGLVAMAFGFLIDYRSYRKHAKKATAPRCVLRWIRNVTTVHSKIQPAKTVPAVLSAE